MHSIDEFSNYSRTETVLRCGPFSLKTNEPDCLVSEKYTSFSWQGDDSLFKLNSILASQSFLDRKINFLDKSYNNTEQSVNEALDDVQQILFDLHLSSCKKKIVNTKRNKFKSKRQPWFNNNCQFLRNRVRLTAKLYSSDPIIIPIFGLC